MRVLVARCKVQYCPFFGRKEDVVKMASVFIVWDELMWQFIVLYDEVTKRDGV